MCQNRLRYRKRTLSAKPYYRGVWYPNSVISTFLRELSAWDFQGTLSYTAIRLFFIQGPA